ncbi:zinc finger protein 17-like isoform X2 [Rhipicephalus sanguineus]|uniref:zinc finger protein 17-like isoform X2 n=1 Tax=Rhipicephalus sanguineus TaxID=34632 RepID=UPI0020C33180|nr:zinc finger protein 17-like isoform X2 [Rhipicephalus sanguineus]
MFFAAGTNAVTIQRVVYCCDVCGEAFRTTADLDNHRQDPHHERPEGKHRCSYCPYSSDNKSHTTRHERTHTGERPFTCTVCQKGFNRADLLERHMNIHTRQIWVVHSKYGQYVKPEAPQEAALSGHQGTHLPLLRQDVSPEGTTPQAASYNAHTQAAMAVQEVFPSFRHFKISQEGRALGTSACSGPTASPTATGGECAIVRTTQITVPCDNSACSTTAASPTATGGEYAFVRTTQVTVALDNKEEMQTVKLE